MNNLAVGCAMINFWSLWCSVWDSMGLWNPGGTVVLGEAGETFACLGEGVRFCLFDGYEVWAGACFSEVHFIRLEFRGATGHIYTPGARSLS